MESWTLHDVQAPQSPEPAITRSHSRASSSITSILAGMDAAGFLRLTTRAAPYLATSSSPRSSTRLQKFGFELSMNPTTAPAKFAMVGLAAPGCASFGGAV